MSLFRRFRRSGGRIRSAVSIVEPLERRTLLNATVTATVSPISVNSAASPTTINLNTYFNDPLVPGTAVEIETPQGAIPIALTNAATPETVANFLSYIFSGAYQNDIIHRAIPGFVIQGGGFNADGSSIASTGTVNTEPGTSNTAGTIAMALSNGPNSGTNQWFINLANNNTPGGLDLDDQSDGGPFTVFGTLVYNGLNVANSIASLEVVNDSAQNGNFTDLPVEADPGSTTPATVPAGDMVTADPIIVSALTYTVMSSDTSLVVPSVNAGALTLSYGSGPGVATITVTATDLGGNTASETFNVDVGGTNVVVGKGQAKSVHFTDPNGTATTIALGGPGAATVSFTGTGLTETETRGVVTISGATTNVSINASGTTAASSLQITSRGAQGISIGDIVVSSGSIGTISARNVQLTGDVTVAGTANSIVLGSANTGNITVGGSGNTAIQIVGSSTDNVELAGGLKSLTAGNWVSGTIEVPTIFGAMNVKGVMGANVSAGKIGAAHAGSISGGSWVVSGVVSALRSSSISNWTGDIGDIAVLAATGEIGGVNLRSDGTINSITARGIANSNIYAGLSALPPSAVPIASEQTFRSNIGTLSVGANGLSNFVIAAANELVNVNVVGPIVTNNGGTQFGFAAGEVVNMMANAGGTKKLHLHATTSAGQVTAAESAAGVTPVDFTVAIL